MSEKLHVGAAWKEATASDPNKRYYRVAVDLGGLVPPAYCRIVENSKPKKDLSPTHYMFFSPVDGDDRRVGAFWTQKSKESGTTYLMGELAPSSFGVIELKGGAKLDLRLAGGVVRVKLVAAKPAAVEDGKNRPTHYLLRMAFRAKKGSAEAVEAEEILEEETIDEEEAA